MIPRVAWLLGGFSIVNQFCLACIAATFLALFATPAEAERDEGPPIPASTVWDLDYGLENCRLARTFGTGDDAVTLYLTQTRPGNFFDLTLAGSRFGKTRSVFGTKAYFGDLKERKFSDTVWISEASDGRPVLLLGMNTFSEWDDEAKEWTPSSTQVLKSIDELEFDVPRMDAFTLATGPMDKPVAAVSACYDDLLKTWGFEPEAVRSQLHVPEPLADPCDWLDSRVYPEVALRNGEGAIIDFRLIVDVRGRVEACVVQQQVGDPVFAEAACGALKGRVLFKPALDAAGAPTRGLWFNHVRFEVH